MNNQNNNSQANNPKKHKNNTSKKRVCYYLGIWHKLLCLLCVLPLLFWVLNLMLFSGGRLAMGYGLLASLFLLVFSIFYIFSVRIAFGTEYFYWRSNLDFRLYRCKYSAIRELQGEGTFVYGQLCYDFALLLHDGRRATFSLGSNFGALEHHSATRMVRAFMDKKVRISLELLHYFLYSNKPEGQLLGQLMQLQGGKLKKATALRRRKKRNKRPHSSDK